MLYFVLQEGITGYRSDVAFTLTVNGYETGHPDPRDTFKKMLGFFKLSEFYRVVTSPQYKCVDCKELGWSWRDGSITFCVSGWKWYEGYTVVEAFDEMWKQMRSLAEKNDPPVPISGYFIRSGEEMDDTHSASFGEQPDWDMGYVSKTFHFE